MAAPADLRAFCEQQHPQLVGLLGLYCGDVHVAEELAQEALVRVCSEWSRVRVKDSPSAWTTRVALNLANSHYRRKKAEHRARTRVASRARVDRTSDLAEALSVRAGVAAMPRRQRTAIVLRYFLDLSYGDIADFMGVSLSSAKMLVHRGVERLRAQQATDLKEVPDVG